MQEHLTEDELKGYASRRLAASALLSADRHLSNCAECRYTLQRKTPAPPLPNLVVEMAEPVHLSYEQMSAYADANLSEPLLKKTESHIAICRACASELKDLMKFDRQIAQGLDRTAASPQVEEQPGWVDRMRAMLAEWLAAPRRMGFATAGVALMMLGVFSLMQAGGPGGNGSRSSAAMARVSQPVLLHPHLFYGGFVIAGCGLLFLLFGLRKR